MQIDFPGLGIAELRLYHNAESPYHWIDRNDPAYYYEAGLKIIDTTAKISLYFAPDLKMIINGVTYQRLVFSCQKYHDGATRSWMDARKTESKNHSDGLTDKAREYLKEKYSAIIEAAYPSLLPIAIDNAKKAYADDVRAVIRARRESMEKAEKAIGYLSGYIGENVEQDDLPECATPPDKITIKKNDKLSFLGKNSWYKREFSGRMARLGKMPISYVHSIDRAYKIWKENPSYDVMNEGTVLY